MTNATNIDLDFRFGRSCYEFIPTTTGHLGFNVFRMNVLFHGYACNFVGALRAKNTLFIVPEEEKIKGGEEFRVPDKIQKILVML